MPSALRMTFSAFYGILPVKHVNSSGLHYCYMSRERKVNIMASATFGVILGTRGFFPDHLCAGGRQAILEALEQNGFGTVMLGPDCGKSGAIESVSEARACAELFKCHREEIDGIIVSLPNFGDERAIANAIRWSELQVPVLVQAFPDQPEKMTVADRRDSFCGKMSACNNLRQYGIAYSLTSRHTIDPASRDFAADLDHFAAVCRVVRGLKHLRIGMIGARPAPFNTVRFSERILEANGISVETLDLSELLGRANRLAGSEKAVRLKIEAIKGYTGTDGVDGEALVRMARLGVVIDRWMVDNELKASSIQCWTALEDFYGVVPCTLMSMMSEGLLPSACETDIGGLLGMYVMQCAAGRPSALLDWNNNYGDDQDKGVMFHCSNLPASFFDRHRMDYQAIIAGAVGKENTFGTMVGRIKPGPFTFCRVSTDDTEGVMAGYVGEGRFTDDRLQTFGGYGVFEIPGLQRLLALICAGGFEHHAAVNLSSVAAPVNEALRHYLGWDIYYHDA